MNRPRSIWLAMKTLTIGGLCWVAVHGTTLAASNEEKDKASGGGAWTMSYMLVVLGLALGMMLVCRTARRRDRAKPETYGDAKLTTEEKKKGPSKKKKKKRKKR